MSMPRWVSILLRPLAWGYCVGVVCWRIWRLRVLRPRRASVAVVSVGNLTVGGTGKGPLVRWLVATLRDAGATPVIALRGYRAGPQGSDEALEHARLLPGIRVAVGRDRAAAIDEALALDHAIDVAVLDDGFQHWRLARDLDLVLIDATRPALDAPMVPAGPRREPIGALRRADAVIVTRCDRVDASLAARIEALHGRAPIAWCRHAWDSLTLHAWGKETSIRNSEHEAGERVARHWLATKRVGVISAIGHPEAFFAQVSAHSAQAMWLLRGRDHDHFDAAQLDHLGVRVRDERIDAIVTTMKDWVKLERIQNAGTPLHGVPFVVPTVSIEFIAGEAALRELVRSRLNERRRVHG